MNVITTALRVSTHVPEPAGSYSLNVLKDLARFMIDAWTITLSFRAYVGDWGGFVSSQHVQGNDPVGTMLRIASRYCIRLITHYRSCRERSASSQRAAGGGNNQINIS